MNIIKKCQVELDYLKSYKLNSIMLTTTAKHALDFKILPRKTVFDMAISNFMINNEVYLKDTLAFFDGKINKIFIDVEQKQSLNILKVAKDIVQDTNIITVKPNDTTVESCDLLIRSSYNDDLQGKKILVIGTGNLASKLAVRLAERQAIVYIAGRTTKKEKNIVEALNSFLPKYTNIIQTVEAINQDDNLDIVISFLSGQFKKEDELTPFINKNTFIIDGGINNFSAEFIQRMLDNNVRITRLDTRIALPYQLLSEHDYTTSFFKDIFGQSEVNGIVVVSGGYIGKQGSVIVDNIKEPYQVIGIADGSGGVKSDEQLSESDRSRIQKIKQSISKNI
ncbi:hypothetical protein [Oceanobacillus sp. CAU 1775]